MDAGDQAPSLAYSEDGVDLTLIRWMLSLTPAQRLEFLEERVNETLAIRNLNAGSWRGPLSVCSPAFGSALAL